MVRVFLSHSSQDRGLVDQRVVPLLDRCGLDVWYAPTDIRTATDWEAEIRAGLASTDWMIVVVTPHAVDSRWVKAEVDWALERLPDRVLPLVFGGASPGDIHLLLRNIQFVDMDHAAREDLETALAPLLAWTPERATLLGRLLPQLSPGSARGHGPADPLPMQWSLVTVVAAEALALLVLAATGGWRWGHWLLFGEPDQAGFGFLEGILSPPWARLVLSGGPVLAGLYLERLLCAGLARAGIGLSRRFWFRVTMANILIGALITLTWWLVIVLDQHTTLW